MDTQTGNPMGGESHKAIIPIILAIVVIIAGYLIFKYMNTPHTNMPAGQVTYTDLKTSVTKIPEGFPTNIPVEAQNVKDSYKVAVKDSSTTQYTVSFTSSLDKAALWKTYSDLFTSLGYAVDAGKTSQDSGVMEGFRSGNKLNISIKPYGSEQYVTINYIARNS